jgi:C4-dicarboxylate-specific signal transduction histidine kinase
VTIDLLAMSKSAEPKFWSLEGKLVFTLLLISTTVTTFLTIGTIYFDYRAEIAGIEHIFHQIENSSLPVLAASVWDFDQGKIKSNVEGLQNIEDLQKIRVLDPSGKVLESIDKAPGVPFGSGSLIVREYTLVHLNTEKIGTLQVAATQENMYERLLRKLIIFFLTQFLKTLTVSFLIMVAIRRLVTKPLSELRQYLERAQNISISELAPLKFSKKRFYVDELDELLKAFNQQNSRVVDFDHKKQDLIQTQSDEIELRRAAAIEADRLVALGEMASGVAHEINNPNAVIKGNAEILQKEIPQKPEFEKVHGRLKKIIEMVNRVGQIVQSMRLSARDGSKDELLATSVGEIFADSASLFELRFKNSGVEFRTKIECDPLSQIKCRRVQLTQVITNLLNNAFDAVEAYEAKWIGLKGTVQEGNLLISITDSGNGIEAGVLAKMFQLFYTTKTVGKGTGLGLSISTKIALEHGGSLTYNSKSAHTQFVLSVPLAVVFSKAA